MHHGLPRQQGIPEGQQDESVEPGVVLLLDRQRTCLPVAHLHGFVQGLAQALLGQAGQTPLRRRALSSGVRLPHMSHIHHVRDVAEAGKPPRHAPQVFVHAIAELQRRL